MDKKDTLDAFEQDIEDNFEALQPITNVQEAIAAIQQAAIEHAKLKKLSED